MLSETDIIHDLKNSFPSHIGDDAAVIPAFGEQSYVITKDLLVEDTHFRQSYVDAPSLAQKALQVNLSDVAAMGAKPCFILLGIAIPEKNAAYAKAFLDNFALQVKQAGLILIGGDTVKSVDKLMISITAIGLADTENIRYRSKAKIGDIICVAGELGHAHVGFLACEQAKQGFEAYQAAFLRPMAKLAEGQWLAQQHAVTSMMDLSDSLYVDLKRLCKSSEIGAELNLDQLKPEKDFTVACEKLGIEPVQAMLSGGEDYGLLFTIEKAAYDLLSQKFYQKFGYKITPVGSITSSKEIKFIENGVGKNLILRPFSHFGETP